MTKAANIHGTSGGSVTIALPAFTFEVIDAAGTVHCGGFPNSMAAQAWAVANMAGPQDTSGDGEEPNGWDIQRCPDEGPKRDVQVVGAGNG